RGAVAGDVVELDLLTFDDTTLYEVEMHRRRPAIRGAIPPGGIDDDRARRRFRACPERFGQRTDELAQRRLDVRRRRRGWSGDKEQGAGLGGGETAQVGPSTPCELPAAVAPLGRIDRKSRHPERLE